LPVNTPIYKFRPNNDRNGGWNINKDFHHVLSLESYPYDISYTLDKLKGNKSFPEEYYDDNVVTAGHELSHAAFAELFDPNTIYKVSLKSNKERADLYRALTEGYSIICEKYTEDVLNQLTPVLPDTFNMGISSGYERNVHLFQYKDNPYIRVYTDGYRIMRRLIWQLGVYNKPKQEQILEVSKYLKEVDIEKAVNLKPDNDSYKLILSDPLRNIPKKSD
jgi:hypothetical protein